MKLRNRSFHDSLLNNENLKFLFSQNEKWSVPVCSHWSSFCVCQKLTGFGLVFLQYVVIDGFTVMSLWLFWASCGSHGGGGFLKGGSAVSSSSRPRRQVSFSKSWSPVGGSMWGTQSSACQWADICWPPEKQLQPEEEASWLFTN